MAIVEGLVVGLGLHLGKKLVDRLWEAILAGETPVADQSGDLSLAASHGGRTAVGRDRNLRRSEGQELVLGEFYLPAHTMNTLIGDEVAVVLVIEETQSQVLLFRADLETGYEIYLHPGIYSFYGFLMDPDAEDFYDAEIYAFGFPSKVDLDEVEQFELEDPEDVWDIVSDSPIEIQRGGPYALDLVLIDSERLPEFPATFSEILGETAAWDTSRPLYDLTGTWQLEEEYEFGSTVADAYLVQSESELHGLILIRDTTDDGTELILQEAVTGTIEGAAVYLGGITVRVIKGRSQGYLLDRWEGVMEGYDRVRGISEDEAGTVGAFVMQRVSAR